MLQGYVNVFAHLQITITLYSQHPDVMLRYSHDLGMSARNASKIGLVMCAVHDVCTQATFTAGA